MTARKTTTAPRAAKTLEQRLAASVAERAAIAAEHGDEVRARLTAAFATPQMHKLTAEMGPMVQLLPPDDRVGQLAGSLIAIVAALGALADAQAARAAG